MLFLLHGLGYRIVARQTPEYESFRAFVAQTEKDDRRDRTGSFCAAARRLLTVPTRWFLKTLTGKHLLRSEDRYRYYYIAACFRHGVPLSAAIYGYGSEAGTSRSWRSARTSARWASTGARGGRGGSSFST
jgi:hypothetical protein